MQTKFRRHQKVRILVEPDSEYIEYDPDFDDDKPQIKKGAIGKVNVILPNGQYHIAIIDEKTGKTIAYIPVDEEFLERVE